MNDKTKSDLNKSLPPRPASTELGARKAISITVAGDREHFFSKERVVVGSVVSADIRITGDGVAPIHAVIEKQGETKTVVYDLASDTGVFVNGKKVVTHELSEGDDIQIGIHHLKFASVQPKTETSSKRIVREGSGRQLYYSPNEDFASLILEDEKNIEEIFDYRPTTKQALEVVMSWNEVILNVEHFVSERTVLLGASKKSDFGIPPILNDKHHPLVHRIKEDFILNLDSAMTGVIHRGGKLIQLEDLKRTATRGLHGAEIPLQKEDFVKIYIGEITFFMSFTAAPPRLKMSRLFERDPLFLKVFWTSMVLTAVTVFGLMSAQVPQSLEAEQLPERIATILYQPEKYNKPPVPIVKAEPVVKEPEVKVEPKIEKPKPTPKATAKLDITPKAHPTPKPVPKVMDVGAKEKKVQGKAHAKAEGTKNQAQAKAKEGEGARAKGKEGTRGTPKAAKAEGQPQAQAKRPSPEAGKGKGGGNSQVADIGNVDFMKSGVGRIENILGNSAARLGKGGDKLKGFGGFNTLGTDGLAVSGKGAGGGGTAEGLGGLGKTGKGGGRVGTGMGAAGTGSGIVGGQARVAIRTGGPEEAVVMGSIDADAVEAALLAHKDEFRLCYEKELNAEAPRLAGRVGTNFVIGSSGRVSQAGVESSTLKNPNVEKCIISVIKRIDFPIPRGAGVVQVTYPFKFVSLK